MDAGPNAPGAFERVIPGAGEPLATRALAQAIGAQPAHAETAGRLGRAGATRESENEASLPARRPAVAARGPERA